MLFTQQRYTYLFTQQRNTRRTFLLLFMLPYSVSPKVEQNLYNLPGYICARLTKYVVASANYESKTISRVSDA